MKSTIQRERGTPMTMETPKWRDGQIGQAFGAVGIPSFLLPLRDTGDMLLCDMSTIL